MSMPSPEQDRVLRSVLQRVAATKAGHATPVVVFDLDATLYDNRPRTLAILAEYRQGTNDPALSAALDTVALERVDYLLVDTLRRCGITHTEHVKEITRFWHERFFVDSHIRHDVPLAGAAAFVTACHDAGAIVVYLTGRDVPGMFLGTVASLRDCGFPIGIAGVELVLKPDAHLADEAFKRGAIPSLARLGPMVAFFDNEPANCNVAQALCPAATVVLLDTQKVPHAPARDPGVEVVRDFTLA